MENNSFNEGLGKKLKAERALFQPWKNRTWIVAGIAIAVAVLVVISVSQSWIGF